ncbi:MAG: sulfatase-like hydrolase/transferase, partial [Xanthomonadales bacterium]|nr:sulfatase-like hydrolase/transferase [Xanthomonadales bacterium]NIX12357.1 sulfatase-like hydrolase/transferase [Xanthomonadales bacterium]
AILSGHHPARGEMTSVAGGNPPHPGHPTGSGTITPWYSSRIPTETFTLAEALKAEGYVTGHSGKWHVSKHHYDYPNPYHHGFDRSTHHRGVQSSMTPDRLTGFATRDPDDPYRLDDNGYPFDVPQHAALDFMRENKDQPFFLYYATWLVHGPWVMRSEALLRKYEQKLGVTITDKHKDMWDVPGQKNPFYCAMVEQLDYYMGQVFRYLEETDDPRWPGHKLIENTYIIFTSDNGGAEGNHMVTDNYPLDRGKISLKEGGTRVPLIIVGPGIPAGVQTDVMANGLDFYPTILSWVGARKPKDKILDGCDLAPLLAKDPTNPRLVRDARGRVRDTMTWHFPQSENTSTIRQGDYKLLRRYAGLANQLELYRLYHTDRGRAERGDIEEMKNLADRMPAKTAALDDRLAESISEMGGRLPYFNPQWT